VEKEDAEGDHRGWMWVEGVREGEEGVREGMEGVREGRREGWWVRREEDPNSDHHDQGLNSTRRSLKSTRSVTLLSPST
jgi:hypothetical protein